MSILEAISPTARAVLAKSAPAKPGGPRQLILKEVAFDRARLFSYDDSKSDDDKLVELCGFVGSLAQHVHNNSVQRNRELLVKIAAHCAGWVTALGTVKDVFKAISDERDRQQQLFAGKKITFNCASPLIDRRRKFRVLVEEVGEVAQECDNLERCRKPRVVRPFLREELIQVAAVCVAWLESYEVQS